MTFEIVPSSGIAGLPFGSTKAEVRAFFGHPPQEFRRGPTANVSDHWSEVAAFAYYDSDGLLEAVEFASPAHVGLGGANLLDLDGGQAKDVLSALDPDVRVEADGLVSDKVRVSIWTDTPPLEGGTVQSVLVFKANYYA